LLVTALTVLFGPGPIDAAQARTSPLAVATHLKCTFPVMTTATWSKDGDAAAEVKKSTLTLEYKSIDVAGGSAEAVGLSGNFLITVRFIADSLHLLTIGDAGPSYLTTVFNRPNHPGTFKAAHTRHEFTDVSLPGFTSRPEQYVGECQILDP
jgi:hypothetical protein